MKTRLFFLASTVILATLFFTGTVFAEGEVPPEIPMESPTSVEEAIIVEAAPPPAEGPPASEEPAVTAEVQPEAPAIEATPVEEVLPVVEAPVVLEAAPEALIPDQMIEEPSLITDQPEVLLVDQTGEPLDMASQTSAEAVASADPYFTVGLITYRFSEVSGYCDFSPDPAHCFDPSTTHPLTGSAIQFALDYISNTLHTPPTNGLIYVEKATYSGDVTINALAHSEFATLKGLIGLADLVTGEFPTIGGNVSISSVASGFTLSGFTINGAVIIDNVTGVLTLKDLSVQNTSGTGIAISNHKGNVNLTNVKSSYNRGNGAQIQVLTTGTVTVLNSAFDKNDYADGTHYATGLAIITDGIISIDGLSASRNNGDGLRTLNFSKLTIKNAVLNENKTVPFNSSYGHGLMADTTKAAPATLETVYANDNSLIGIYITTNGGAISLNHIEANNMDRDHGAFISNATATVSISNSSFSDNANTGLLVYSRRAVTLTSIRAENNVGSGIHVDNCNLNAGVCMGSGAVTLTSPAAGGTVGANTFNNNTGGYGLEIESFGSVTLTNLHSDSNLSEGVFIDNHWGTGGITINKNLAGWTNTFNFNNGHGLRLYTKGSVSISDSDAMDNGASGVNVTYNTTQNVSISRGNFTINGQDGLYILSRGNVTLTDIEAAANDDNYLDTDHYSGANINNSYGTGSVTIKSSSPSKDYLFTSNAGYGIYIISRGVISVSNVHASDNGFQGTYFQGLFANNASSSSSPVVSVTHSVFDRNGAEGVVIYSKGAVTLTDVSASENDYNRSDGITFSGARIDNSSGSGGVTIKSSSISLNYSFINNTDNGITIDSKGIVSVSNVTASNNFQNGLDVDNTLAAGSSAVSIIKSVFENNRMNGIKTDSKGAITLTDTSANSNGSAGAYSGAQLNNTLGSASAVTVTSSSTANRYGFNLNTSSGIRINSNGAVTVNNIITDNNQGYGLEIRNYYAASAKPVTVARSELTGNNKNGLFIQTIGAVTLNSIQSNDNGHTGGGYSGVYVDACMLSTGCQGVGGITLIGSGNEFIKNGAYGLELGAFGSFALSNFTADQNIFDGVNLFNQYTGSTGSVTISASSGVWNSASYNEFYGLDIYSYGTISISRLKAEGNLNSGAYLTNEGSTPRNITLNDCTFNSNEGIGVQVRTAGTITFNGVAANWNSKHSGTIADEDAGELIYERLTSDSGEDIWNFKGDSGDSYTIELLDTEFDGHLELYTNANVLVASDDSDPLGTFGTLVKIVIPSLSTTGDYYVRVSGGIGDYTLYFNSPVQQQSFDYHGAHIQSSGVTINSSITTLSTFNENNLDGIRINNPGNSSAISIINTSAIGNGYKGTGEGIHIETGSSNVSITTSGTTINSSFNNNNKNGLYILNLGNITLSGRISANSNLQGGACLYNYLASPTAKPVSVSGFTANDNQDGYGLDIETKGSITLTNITANGNSSSGCHADNYQGGSGSGNLTMTGINTYSDNLSNGFEAETNGIVSITGVTADRNGNHGMTLSSYGAGRAVSLKSINTLSNTKMGLNLHVTGTTTLDGIKSYFNGNDGLFLFAGAVNVTIKNSTLIGNKDSGIELWFTGTYSLLNTSYFGNDTNHTFDKDLYIH